MAKLKAVRHQNDHDLLIQAPLNRSNRKVHEGAKRAEDYVDDSEENDAPIIEWLRRRADPIDWAMSSRKAEFDDGVAA